ncbi:WD40 repeat-containing protein [Hirschfeldia incana]|nr:WD40 repeat-containing protein [Hirschfeldia incana]
MITAVSWIPKGASKAMPDAAEPPSDEKMKELIKNGTLMQSTCYLSDMDDDEMEGEIQSGEVAHAKAVAKSFGKPCSNSKAASSSSPDDDDDLVKFLKELDMDNYDEEDDELELFGSGPGDLFYPSNEMDPYLKHDTDANSDTDEDLDALTIQPTDSLIICTRIKKKLNFLEVYVCEVFEDGTHNIYLHQDIMIPKPALCTAWLDCPLKGGEKGNFVAVGSLKSPIIEIWDLDVMNEVLPCVQLGRADGHTGSVIGLAWNKEFRNIVASASADKSVKVWDVSTGKCMVTMNHHTKKVQAVAWNHYVPQVLLSGSLDRTVALKDGRDPSHSGLKWSTKAKVESLAWDPHSEHSFVVSLNDGTVKGFDIRASELSPSFTLHAHDEEVSSISYNTRAPNLLATGSGDKSVKLWDLSNNQPSWVATHNPNAGIVLSVSFSADCPFLLAVGGLEGELNVWDTLSDAAVSRRYGC